MLIAALYDIHGNLPALEAVLADAAGQRPDLIVVGGDVVSGPMPAGVLEALLGSGVPLRWVMGNADRAILAPGDGDEPVDVIDRWVASRLSPDQLALIASFEPTVPAGGALFCHGSPRSDTERMTRITRDRKLARMLAEVDERVVVCGHTHQQFDRAVDHWRIVNAGSVGVPYEGRPGAFWALLDGREVSLRCTEYDVAAACEAMRATGLPDIDEFMLRESLLEPADPDEVAEAMEMGP